MDQNNKRDRGSGEEEMKVDSKTKGQRPDPDVTDPSTLPTTEEEARTSISEKGFSTEHSINRDHAEPTELTHTSNDNYVESKYIDVGGGD